MRSRLVLFVLPACATMQAEPDTASVDAKCGEPSTWSAPGPILWVITRDATAELDRLYAVDPWTLDAQEIGLLDTTEDLWELTEHPDYPGVGFTIDRTNDAIYALDLWSGAILYEQCFEGDMAWNGRGFDFDAQGRAFGILEGDELWTIDLWSGETAHVGDLSGIGGGVEAMAFCGDDLLVAASTSGSPKGTTLFEVDPDTAVATKIATIGSTTIDVDTLTCSPAGQLFGVDTSASTGKMLYQIDRRTGTRIELGQLDVEGDINGVHLSLR